MAEFLPLCDLLFNIVSLAAYFCDVVFDILVVYALYHEKEGFMLLFAQCLGAIVLSSIVTQCLSIYWYLKRKPPTGPSRVSVIGLHCLQLGVLWRYGRLLVPVQISSVKREVRDLCILRLVHGFLQAAPMLLIQLSLLPETSAAGGGGVGGPPANLVTVSTLLSLFSVCWALASFSKHVQRVDRLVLTWLGVVFQLLWRLGTVTARAMALTAYAASYHSWIFLVLALHWACMFLWLLSPRSPFHGQRGSKLGLCALTAAIYVFAYVNLHERPHRRTMAIFYVVMLLENCLLIGAWLTAAWHVRPPNWQLVPLLSLVFFFTGITFMLVYYKYFHVKRLMEKPQQAPPGVFNCRFANNTTSAAAGAAALYRKKKKPTSFVPPPPTCGLNPGASPAVGMYWQYHRVSHATGPSEVVRGMPFWRRPLPSSSENEGSSVGSRVNIHQKLQEKKQKQLAELKIIEEEIKQGKLVGPEGGDLDDRQPIPRTKRHVEPHHLLSLASLNNLASYGVNLNHRRPPPPRAPGRSRTPELLLAPRYLYCGGGGGGDSASIIVPPPQPKPVVEHVMMMPNGMVQRASSPHNNNLGASPPSDLDSQVSLPRSFTLPREFKYYRKQQRHHHQQQQHQQQQRHNVIHAVASTNSSDADVDSADDDESDCNNKPQPAVVVRHLKARPAYRHETKL